MRDTIPWPINEKLIYLPELQQFVWHSFASFLANKEVQELRGQTAGTTQEKKIVLNFK